MFWCELNPCSGWMMWCYISGIEIEYYLGTGCVCTCSVVGLGLLALAHKAYTLPKYGNFLLSAASTLLVILLSKASTVMHDRTFSHKRAIYSASHERAPCAYHERHYNMQYLLYWSSWKFRSGLTYCIRFTCQSHVSMAPRWCRIYLEAAHRPGTK